MNYDIRRKTLHWSRVLDPRDSIQEKRQALYFKTGPLTAGQPLISRPILVSPEGDLRSSGMQVCVIRPLLFVRGLERPEHDTAGKIAIREPAGI